MHKLTRTVLELDDKTRTKEVMMDRLKHIQSSMSRAAGVLLKLNEERLKRNGSYWINTMHGWADYLRQLSAELVVIHAWLLDHTSE